MQVCSVKQTATEMPAINKMTIRNTNKKAAKYFNAQPGIPLAGHLLYDEHRVTTRLKFCVRLVLFYAIKRQVPNLSTCVPSASKVSRSTISTRKF